jgi:hypothetical protein
MILNSIGFYTNGTTPQSLSYSVKGNTYNVTNFSDPNLGPEVNGFRWLTISPQSMLNNDIVTVTTQGPLVDFGGFSVVRTQIFNNFTVNPNANVAYLGLATEGTIYSNSNLRVSNPGSNVAPEPGSIALLLTGGGALAGIALRRRRNAA